MIGDSAEQKLLEMKEIKNYEDESHFLEIKETPNSKSWIPMKKPTIFGRCNSITFNFPTFGIYRFDVNTSHKNIKSASKKIVGKMISLRIIINLSID